MIMDVQDSFKVILVAFKLKGGVTAWWVQLCENRHIYSKLPIRTRERMEKLICAKFLL